MNVERMRKHNGPPQPVPEPSPVPEPRMQVIRDLSGEIVAEVPERRDAQ